MKNLFLIFLLILLTGCYNSPNNINNEKKLEISINGIDVSHHNCEKNKKIQWDSLKEMKFIYIKSSQGDSYKDPKRILNYNNAKKYNIPVGFYIYWEEDISGKKHFDNFKESVKNLKMDLPPVLDLEEGVRDTFYQMSLIEEIRIFSELCEKEFKTKPIIYTWYDSAIQLHQLDSTYKYWLNISSRTIRNPHKKFKIDYYSKVPWVMLQCGCYNYGTGYINLNYGKLGKK